MSAEARRVAVVTGGAHGIGRAVAEALAASGSLVVVADKKPAPQVPMGPASGVTSIITDVTDARSVARLFASVASDYGRLDVLVNNAGIAHGPESESHFFDTSPDMWDNLMATHVRGLYLCCQHAARAMTVQPEGGVIVNMSSLGAVRAHRDRVAYDATKGAIEAATRALALDLAPWRIRVNAVAPGAIAVANRTPIGDGPSIPPEHVIPLGRLGTPEEVAACVRFLSSPEAAYVTGTVLTVDGGLGAQLRSPVVDVTVTNTEITRELPQ